MDEQFRTGLAETLEADPSAVTEATVLADNWDSVAVMTTISLIDQLYDVTVSANELEACSTVGDLWRLVQKATA